MIMRISPVELALFVEWRGSAVEFDMKGHSVENVWELVWCGSFTRYTTYIIRARRLVAARRAKALRTEGTSNRRTQVRN